MDLSPGAAAWFLLPLTPLCLHVVWSDLSALKIRNGAVEAIAMSYILLGPLLLPWEMYLWNFSHLLVMLGIGLVLNLAGVMGGGDAKFLAAAAPFVARPDIAAMAYILAATMIGAILVHRAAMASPLRRLVPDWESWHSGRRFPMGFPFATALMIYLALVAAGRL